MPTYDYICSNCGRKTEIVHSISSSAPRACPACGAVGTLSKAFNPPTIHFKGSGWAKKDRTGARSRPSTLTDSSEPSESGPANGPGGEGGSPDAGKVGDGKGSVPGGKPESLPAKAATSPASPASSAD